jgi:hypothetical protein
MDPDASSRGSWSGGVGGSWLSVGGTSGGSSAVMTAPPPASLTAAAGSAGSGGAGASSGGAAGGVTIVRDGKGIQQLSDVLAAAPSWAFSLAFDTDHAVCTPGEHLNGIVLPKPPPPGKRKAEAGAASGSASGASAADAQAGSDDEAGQPQKQQWRWSVMGVAFSVADGSAFYVPLTSSSKGGSSSAPTVRMGTSSRVKQLWAGLLAIFNSSSSGAAAEQQQQQPGGDMRSRLLLLAAHAASSESAPTSGGVKREGQQAVLGSSSAAWWGAPGPIRVSFALKPQLALLAQPPAASGLHGLCLSEPFVDVRVALWMLNPDAANVEEGSWAGSTGCRCVCRGQQLIAAHTRCCAER